MAQLVREPPLRRQIDAASLKHMSDFQAHTVIPHIEQLYLRLTASHNAAAVPELERSLSTWRDLIDPS